MTRRALPPTSSCVGRSSPKTRRPDAASGACSTETPKRRRPAQRSPGRRFLRKPRSPMASSAARLSPMVPTPPVRWVGRRPIPTPLRPAFLLRQERQAARLDVVAVDQQPHGRGQELLRADAQHGRHRVADKNGSATAKPAEPGRLLDRCPSRRVDRRQQRHRQLQLLERPDRPEVEDPDRLPSTVQAT